MSERLDLDKLAAQAAQKMVDGSISALLDGKTFESEKKKYEAQEKAATATDNLITKALGVLQENGTYASALFLLSRTSEEDKKVSSVVRAQLLNLAGKLRFGWNPPGGNAGSEKILAFYSDEVTADLDKLLLLKELYEQTLIYARYGAKAAAADAKAKAERG